MAVDISNVRPDLVKVSLGGNEYLEAKAEVDIGGEKIGIFSARFGEEIGHIQGARNMDVVITYVEGSPSVVRALLGFDGSGEDTAAAVGAAPSYQVLVIQDPTDVAGLGKLTFHRVALVGAKFEHDGRGVREVVCTFRAYLDSAIGKVWSVGS